MSFVWVVVPSEWWNCPPKPGKFPEFTDSKRNLPILLIFAEKDGVTRFDSILTHSNEKNFSRGRILLSNDRFYRNY